MKIIRLNYENITYQYKIENMEFDPDFSLLVGTSGAGKTMVLNALRDCCRLACGKNLSLISYGFSAQMEFSLPDGEKNIHRYLWSVSVDALPVFDKTEEANLLIQNESLTMDNGTFIFKRDKDGTKVIDFTSVPQPKENESLISQYRKEKTVKDIFREFDKVYMRSFEMDMRDTTAPFIFREVCKYYQESNISPIRDIGGIDMSPFDRLGVIQHVQPDMFKKLQKNILAEYQAIFPEVDCVMYKQAEDSYYGIAIRTNGNWIYQRQISSGMLKTLWNIIYLLVLPRNSVLMIDELENGLGINCIDSVSEMLMTEREDIQRIVTSHHPYIINTIPMERWKIIERDKNVIKAFSAKQLQIGNSKHEAYLQLVNRLQYT